MENVQKLNESDFSTTTEKEQPKIEEFPFETLLENLYGTSKSLGQLVFIDKSKDVKNATINVMRMLTNGERQFFQINIVETDEITIKK